MGSDQRRHWKWHVENIDGKNAAAGLENVVSYLGCRPYPLLSLPKGTRMYTIYESDL